MSKQAAILVGAGQFQDRWHDYVSTATEIARILEESGFVVVVRGLKPSGVADIGAADLLVVNAGYGLYNEFSDGSREEWQEAYDLLRQQRRRGIPILALHAASNTLDELPEWREWIGGSWVKNQSMHPPIGEARVQISAVDHAVSAGLEDFTVFDEMYSYLDISPEATVLATHTYEGRSHPLVWIVEHGPHRAIYDALGHDVRSYASAGRRDLLVREARWLVAG
jgi:type 1 glutamine amidotransferase